MDSFSCSFWGHRSEYSKNNMLSTAEAKFLNNTATAVMGLQKLKTSGSSNTGPIDVCLWLPNGSRCFQIALISKRGLDILIMRRPSVIHAALAIMVRTVKSN